MARRPRQIELVFRTWGGKRAGAGRKAGAGREGFVPHAARPAHGANHPVHVTLRAVRAAPMLRAERVFRAIVGVIAGASSGAFRVNHFSVQTNHVHLVVEAHDRVALWRGMQRLAARVARAVNDVAQRRGALFRDRYHRHDLKTPREVRNALVYVIQNVRKHSPAPDRAPRELREPLGTIDDRSSGAWLEGWEPRAGPLVAALRERLSHARIPRAVVPPQTWLGRAGWLRIGRLRLEERPVAG